LRIHGLSVLDAPRPGLRVCQVLGDGVSATKLTDTSAELRAWACSSLLPT